jgi:hypothetical protein
MGLASYEIVGNAGEWRISHDGKAANVYETKESAFEAAVTAASLALRQGHEVRISNPTMAANRVLADGMSDYEKRFSGHNEKYFGKARSWAVSATTLISLGLVRHRPAFRVSPLEGLPRKTIAKNRVSSMSFAG